MKLTEEQREEKPTLDAGQMQLLREAKVIETINSIDIVAIPKNWLDALLSSEQTRKEDADRLEKRMKNYESQAIKNINRAEEAEEQLNQAIELLKNVKSHIPTMQDEDESPSLRHNAGNMILAKIGTFLSQEGEKP